VVHQAGWGHAGWCTRQGGAMQGGAMQGGAMQGGAMQCIRQGGAMQGGAMQGGASGRVVHQAGWDHAAAWHALLRVPVRNLTLALTIRHGIRVAKPNPNPNPKARQTSRSSLA
jgi:hypothetical protein